MSKKQYMKLLLNAFLQFDVDEYMKAKSIMDNLEETLKIITKDDSNETI